MPLRLGAVNISSKFGGVIELSDSTYAPIEMDCVGFSPVVDMNQQPVSARGDDINILKDDAEAWSKFYTQNEPFLFSGYRKEFPVFVSY